MANALLPLQGMSDITSPEVDGWQHVEQTARSVFHTYGYSEIRTPILERSEIFHRSLGDGTDIIQKEMYEFEDRGGRQVALRPEGTASVIRYIAAAPVENARARLYYLGPMFRCERPQAGRKRQFHQVGVEAIGEPNPLVDAEVIAMQQHLLDAWGVTGTRIQLNTRGAAHDREGLNQRLRDALEPRLGDLCEDCRRRFKENILRILDCKKEDCRRVVAGLPPLLELMGEASRAYFHQVTRALDDLGIAYAVNPTLVRGLDYYYHTVWEITSDALGAQDAVSGGGRYVIDTASSTVEGVGFGVGLERLMAILKAGKPAEPALRRPLVWLVAQNEEALAANFKLAQQLRRAHIACRMDLVFRKLKAQMKEADRNRASHTLIRGEQELADGTCQLKDMEQGGQEIVALDRVETRLRALLNV